MTVKEKPGQPSWKELDLPNLREVGAEKLLPVQAVVQGGATEDEALSIIKTELGFVGEETTEIAINTPVGDVIIRRSELRHIVEKRQDARERYVHYAIATLRKPFEVWRVEYDDDSHRFAFIGAFEGKTQMLVVVLESDGKLLWNFMHSDQKSLNKHRHGAVLYRRL